MIQFSNSYKDTISALHQKGFSDVMDEISPAISEIYRSVRQEGDEALVRFSAEFDGVDSNSFSLRVTPEEFRRAASER